MRKRYSRKGSARKRSARRERKARRKEIRQAVEIQLPLNWEELARMLQEGMHSFAVETGLLMAERMLEAEVQRLCGQRYQWQEDREYHRHGRQRGAVTMAGQRVRIQRPRVRRADGAGEGELQTYALFQREDAMPESCLRKMVRGVSCRDYEGVVELAREGFGVKKSSISRHFVKASAKAVQELAERRWDGERFPAILIDGKQYAGTTMVVVLGITQGGIKRVLGLREGATENAEVVTSLLEELRERGLDTSQPTLFVIDGSSALRAAIKRVWGRQALIQRCQIHKKRNVKAHLPEPYHEELDRRLGAAYGETHYEAACAKLRLTARWLAGISPDAAASLREGMDETLTVVRLGVPELLRQTLQTTNPIESALDIVNTLTRRVKHWREGDMRKRWCASGLLRAEEKFHRVKGYRQIPQLIAAMHADLLDTKAKAG